MILAVTGHRPHKLGGYDEPHATRLYAFAESVLCEIRETDADLYVVTGMALGWDQAIAYACHRQRIPFTAAVPYDGQDERWHSVARRGYQLLLAAASRVVVVSPGPYAPWKMHRRNEWMVNGGPPEPSARADRLLALWDRGEDGGTAACVRYADRVGVPWTNVWDAWKEHA